MIIIINIINEWSIQIILWLIYSSIIIMKIIKI